MISFESKGILLITTLLSMFLCALEHSITIWGIFLTMIWALPFNISYIKTKNIYVPMTVHFIGNLLGNGTDIIMTVISKI
ncbi:CPBP family intramembrane metalloprotease [Lachnospiraceae bacterium]|nr:CPBP family intramembrane metalloprotease [Lachnospiraceae bacterium]